MLGKKGSMRHRYAKLVLPLCLLALAMLGSACFQPVRFPESLARWQPESPLILGETPLLTENRWRMVAAEADGAPLDRQSIGALFLAFSNSGSLAVESTRCNDGGFTVVRSKDKRHFTLTNGHTTLMDCGASSNRQWSGVLTAVSQTTTATLAGEQLLLTGDNTRIVLKIDNQ